jgi:hypothetical protein
LFWDGIFSFFCLEKRKRWHDWIDNERMRGEEVEIVSREGDS